jgi:hypothetical protein
MTSIGKEPLWNSPHDAIPRSNACAVTGEIEPKISWAVVRLRCQLNRSMQRFVEVYWREK